MKKLLFLIFVLLFSLLPLSSCGKEDVKQTTDNQKEAFEGIFYHSFAAADLNGNKINQSIFKGKKLTMVNVWATFCGPCLNEMPDLGKLSKSYGDEFQIIGIVSDAVDMNGSPINSQVQKAKSLVKQTGADYLHLIPGKDLLEIHIGAVQAVPETIFLDENGKQVGEAYVGARSEAEWASIIEEMLEKVK